MFEYFMRLQTS